MIASELSFETVPLSISIFQRAGNNRPENMASPIAAPRRFLRSSSSIESSVGGVQAPTVGDGGRVGNDPAAGGAP